jgi:hypothetical protein
VVEVQDEEQTGTLKHNHFVTLVLQTDICLRSTKPPILTFSVLHGSIKIVEELVTQERVVDEVELSSCIVERVVISCTREVKPFRVSKLVSYRSEYSERNIPKMNSPSKFRYPSPPSAWVMSRIILCRETPRSMTGVQSVMTDMLVYISLSHSQNSNVLSPTRLISSVIARKRRNEFLRLVVTLCVCNGLLAVASIRQNPTNTCHIPVLVFLFLEDFDPHVRYGHCQTIVESDTTNRKLQAKSRHSRYIFRDGDTVGIEVVKHLIGLCTVSENILYLGKGHTHEHQVDHALFINVGAKVLVVSSRESSA